ncbi:hypothetical protein BABINDRAFT_160879 [Babjeviella inositovora NRRL Y-12698]|uniref:WLM domain-containing protein n=1 Tax=Babjeviella inositovora NRRL Y-12698 TaxID=984486 RepID=A0A1E3QSD8_9ASCO|nr:uncharacterized protein BABINDRAFT_160879 [Babjeviella inositovora NRRL Y-12698]ODQ80626.1 hypothetical protein BABINDRAFT_160879 [Babjeviella inositovora NRRL Y-12698]
MSPKRNFKSNSQQLNVSPPTLRITKIASLQRKPLKEDALKLIHDIARLVAPIMHKHNFKVGLLCEMFPKNPGLLGLNMNRGQKVCIRLRYATNELSFLPLGDLIGTMLHELTHNLYGPHDNKFYNFLDGLKTEFHDIQIRGSLQTTGYLSEGATPLGGRSLMAREDRLAKVCQTKLVAEKRRLGSNSELGAEGANPERRTMTKKPLRELILEAVERRLKDSKWCHGDYNDKTQQSEAPDDDDLEIIEPIDVEEDTEKFEPSGGNSNLDNGGIQNEPGDNRRVPHAIFKRRKLKTGEGSTEIIDLSDEEGAPRRNNKAGNPVLLAIKESRMVQDVVVIDLTDG